MSLNVCVTDWSDPARWDAAKKARKADLWSLFWTATDESTKDLPGKRLVAFQPGLPINADGTVSGHPYAQALKARVEQYHARTNIVLFQGADGGHLELIDLTARGVCNSIAKMRHDLFSGFAGQHLDYFCRPDSLGLKDKWGVPVTFTPEYLDRWDSGLVQLTSAQRALKPDTIIVGQCDRLTGSTWGAMNGCFIEQRWDFNRRTAQVHAEDLKAFADFQHRYEPSRPMVSVLEVRHPETATAREMDLARAWCLGQGIHLACGRDSAAVGA